MALADYAHHNEDAVFMWWHEEGKHPYEPEYDPDDYLPDEPDWYECDECGAEIEYPDVCPDCEEEADHG